MKRSMELLVTIDTEPDCDKHWNRSSPLSFTSVTFGIPEMLRPMWDKYGVKPIYFVSPEVVMSDECCSVLKDEIRSGSVIGAHLHSEYVEPHVTVDSPEGKPSNEFPCFAHSSEIEYEKIMNFTKLIVDRLNVRPEWYRAARYGADLDTIRSLKRLGYKFDSSVTPGINWSSIGGPDHSRAPQQPYWISKDDFYKESHEGESCGIMEYPITIHGKRFGILGNLLPDTWLFYRWMRPTHMTVFEQSRLIREFATLYPNPVLVLMFHSMEIMVNQTPFVRNRLMQRRFMGNLEAVIRYFREMQCRISD